MASRKDKKGRVFRKGEGYSDAKEMYYYSYTDPFGKRRYIYSKIYYRFAKRKNN